VNNPCIDDYLCFVQFNNGLLLMDPDSEDWKYWSETEPIFTMNFWKRILPLSATKTVPHESLAIPSGELNKAST